MRFRSLDSLPPFAVLSLASLSLGLVLACNKAAPEPPPSPEPAPTPAASAAAAPGASQAPAETASAAAAPTASQPNSIPAPPDVAKPPADAKVTASGLSTKVLTAGKGKDHPGQDDRVKVDYTGWTTDGKMFDSSVARGTPTTFGVGQVIPGWTEGLKLMVVGEKRRLWIPGKLAYGDKPQMGGAPSGPLTFDVELLEIMKPPTVPEDVKAPPKSAKKTASGLYYRVLTPGKGKDHPSATSRVTVNYSGWTTDGKMFDSSVARGEPATFSLNQVIKGWTEGVQLMVVGEKTRFWIPAELAYGDKPARPGAPSGELVFDIELLNIQ
ncbi:MAG TPA: FKBP-type peptidyl-prolyl cis-trans isomerase [Polyangiaceae bacterium]|nr:FKBP-type peptidyl-prolyl cis-trans isomerase [Polyangiaceae bacterium]